VNELDSNLLSGEQIVFQTTKHWFAPIRASLIAILMVLGAGVIRWLSPTGEGILGSIGGLFDLVSTGLLLVAIVWIVYNVAVFLSANFGVTNMRVLRYEGIVRRRSSETLLSMLTDVQLTEPLLGRMLGFGDLRILTASGSAGVDVFETVKAAPALRTAIQEQKAVALGMGATAQPTGPVSAPPQTAPSAPPTAPSAPPTAPSAPATTDDAAKTLATLGDLHKQGLITDEEYAAKRNEILARL
jgi:Bacterial PH domain/Short C-terminal domain